MKGIAITILLLLILASIQLAPRAMASSPPPTVSGTLVLRSGGGMMSKNFLGIVAHTAGRNSFHVDPGVGTFLNNSSMGITRYGEGEDACDVVNNTLYNDNGGVMSGGCQYNITAFKA